MTQPVRLRLSRSAGFDLQAVSLATNGLPAVSVARPSKWGNPFKVAPATEGEGWRIPAITAETAVALFRERYEAALVQYASMRPALETLRGRNLACWCKPDAPCHADVLLDLANRPICDDPRLDAASKKPGVGQDALAPHDRRADGPKPAGGAPC